MVFCSSISTFHSEVLRYDKNDVIAILDLSEAFTLGMYCLLWGPYGIGLCHTTES